MQRQTCRPTRCLERIGGWHDGMTGAGKYEGTARRMLSKARYYRGPCCPTFSGFGLDRFGSLRVASNRVESAAAIDKRRRGFKTPTSGFFFSFCQRPLRRRE
jgi:hypothetical protein